MSVSSNPRRRFSAGIRVILIVASGGVLVRAESLEIDRWSAAGHGGELHSRDEPPTSAQGDQLTDLMPVARDGECLPMLDGIHDLSGPVPQIALGDFRLGGHESSIPGCSTRCYLVLQGSVQRSHGA